MTDAERRLRFEKALRSCGDTHTVDDVISLVRQGEAKYWPNGDGSVVTEIVRYPRLTALNYWLISGKLGDCLEMEPQIEAWAVEQGCHIATALGRKQWGAVVKPRGWVEHGIRYIKPLTRGVH